MGDYAVYIPTNNGDRNRGKWYQDTMSTTDKPAFEIEITPAMIEAGARELIFDAELIRVDVAEDIIRAALREGGYKVVES